MNLQEHYQRTLKFATLKHVAKGQTIPGTNMPYVVHLSNVAMEILIAAPHTADFDTPFAIQVALLHDTLEDTATTLTELTTVFGADVAEAVWALTKDGDLPKDARMTDSLSRIKKLQTEVWAVKMADRITNLQAPPEHWERPKIAAYQVEAKVILETLKGGNEYLENRLRSQIEAYECYVRGKSD